MKRESGLEWILEWLNNRVHHWEEERQEFKYSDMIGKDMGMVICDTKIEELTEIIMDLKQEHERRIR